MAHQLNLIRTPQVYRLLACFFIGLSSCTHEPAPGIADAPMVSTPSNLNKEVKHGDQVWLASALTYAKTLEAGELPSATSSAAIDFSYDGKDYHYTNLKAFRTVINQQLDSLKLNNVNFTFDSTITKPMVSGKLKVIN